MDVVARLAMPGLADRAGRSDGQHLDFAQVELERDRQLHGVEDVLAGGGTVAHRLGEEDCVRDAHPLAVELVHGSGFHERRRKEVDVQHLAAHGAGLDVVADGERATEGDEHVAKTAEQEFLAHDQDGARYRGQR